MNLTAGQADELTYQVASNWKLAGINQADKSLCQFASQLTTLPTQMNENHILELRNNGFSDSAIHDATQVISYFNYINRIADSLNVDLEFDIHTWELSIPN